MSDPNPVVNDLTVDVAVSVRVPGEVVSAPGVSVSPLLDGIVQSVGEAVAGIAPPGSVISIAESAGLSLVYTVPPAAPVDSAPSSGDAPAVAEPPAPEVVDPAAAEGQRLDDGELVAAPAENDAPVADPPA